MNRVLHRRAIIFLLSDFRDQGFERAFKRTGRRHDLIAITITDPREETLPRVGLLELEDAETGRHVVVDTFSHEVRDAYAEAARLRREALRQLARSSRVDLIEVSTDGGHLDALIRFFRLRERPAEETMRRPWTMALTAVCLATGAAPLGPPALVQQQGNAAAAVIAGKGADGGLTVSLSGVVYLTLSVEGPPSLEVEPGQRVLASDAWKVRATLPPATIPLGNGRVRWQQTFQLVPLDRGEQPLALAPLRYRAGPGEAHTVTWRPIPVTVTTAITRVDVGEARDITDIEQLPPVSPWWRGLLWAGLALTVLALAAGAWFLVRRWRRAAPALTPAQAALRELDRLAALKLPQAGRVERFHTLLSSILRRYFERRLQLPVRRQTTTEFLEALRRAPELTPEQQQRVRDFLERCDLAKFAGVTPAPEGCEAVALLARTLVEQKANAPVRLANGTTSAAAEAGEVKTGGIQE